VIVCYLRSSSIGTYSFCEMKYFFAYVLGYKDKDNGKAVQGTVVHKCLEVLGRIKMATDKGLKTVVDEEFGKLNIKKLTLSKLNDLSFDYYSKSFPVLKPETRKICLEWLQKAITNKSGALDPRNQSVHQVEEFFEVDIPHDWARYEYEVAGEKFSGQLGLKGTVDLIFHEEDNTYHILDYKGLPIETKIPTPSGWSTMGDLRVGDIVFDQYGSPTKVTAKSSKKTKPCFRITFDDTSIVECDDEHYWKMLNGEVKQIKELKVGDKIKVASPLECDEVDLPIDPYVLGIWLGDGRNRSFEITSGDDFIFEEIERRGYSLGANQEKRHTNCKVRVVLGSTNKLRKLNLLNNKHIPDIYLRASYSQRLDLLRGLMDSDGSANATRKQCVFMNCTSRLSEDVKSLLLTLGQRPLISNTLAHGFGLEVQAYPVSFRPVNINPFLLPEKKNKVNWSNGNSFRRLIKKIEEVGEKVTQCITVDSEDSTYLCTENMIPTHNTGRRYDWGKEKVKEYKDLQKDKQLLLYYYALRNKYPERDFLVSIYYINDHPIDGALVKGGLFTMAFDDSDYALAEQMIKDEFETIKQNSKPKALSNTCSHWKCRSLCAFSQVLPSIDPSRPACMAIREQIRDKGIEYVTNKYANVQKLTTYGSGGGRLSDEDKNIDKGT
jgi:hypothetical protein